MVILLTEWDDFTELDLKKLSSVMRYPAMADLRNIYDKQTVLSNGFLSYESIGR